jgi:hypothetical protein
MKLYELENEISNVIANPDSIAFVQHNDWNTAIFKQESDYKSFKTAIGVEGLSEDFGYESINNAYYVNYRIDAAHAVFGSDYEKTIERDFNALLGAKRHYAK